MTSLPNDDINEPENDTVPENENDTVSVLHEAEEPKTPALKPIVAKDPSDFFVKKSGKKSGKKTGKKTKKRKSKVKKVLLIILCVLLALILAIVATGFIMYFKGKSHYKNFEINISAPEEAVLLKDDGSEVEYNDVKYVYNDNIVSILVLGVDRYSFEEEKTVGYNGQADAIYLIVLDTETKNATILGLSRDVMADIDVYSTGGKYVGQKKEQICLAYSYGDGKDSSCQNMTKAVARTLYNIPIHNCVSINFNAVPKLVDGLGGLTVPEYVGEEMTEKTGGTMRLNNQNAINYVRAREHESADANLKRMERQSHFIDAFSKEFIAQTKSDISVPIDIYNSLNKYDYMVTDVTASQVTYLATNFISGIKNVDKINVPLKEITTDATGDGEKVHAQAYVDNDALYDIILDLFYNVEK